MTDRDTSSCFSATPRRLRFDSPAAAQSASPSRLDESWGQTKANSAWENLDPGLIKMNNGRFEDQGD